MSGFGFFHGIYRQTANCVYTQIIQNRISIGLLLDSSFDFTPTLNRQISHSESLFHHMDIHLLLIKGGIKTGRTDSQAGQSKPVPKILFSGIIRINGGQIVMPGIRGPAASRYVWRPSSPGPPGQFRPALHLPRLPRHRASRGRRSVWH